jgi:hypothetical protein
VLGVEVRAGNEHSAAHSQPGLLQLLDGLPPERKPRLVRGDNAFGNDGMLRALEARQQPYLFKLKLTKNTKRYIGRLFHEPGWQAAGQITSATIARYVEERLNEVSLGRKPKVQGA